MESPEVISKKEDNKKLILLLNIDIFCIKVENIEKIIIYPQILNILSKEFKIQLSIIPGLTFFEGSEAVHGEELLLFLYLLTRR